MIKTRNAKYFFFALAAIIIQFSSSVLYATSTSPAQSAKYDSRGGGGGGGEVSGSGTLMPDLFTGTMSYSIPIEVVPGRKGMQPHLALTYRSNNGNGWLGVGWDLEIGAIERSAKNGVDYTADKYVLRMNGSVIDLINTSSNSYSAKIEGAFFNIHKITTADGGYWVVYDKTGRAYRFGYSSGSRQSPTWGADRVFKWCLDHVEDTNGNYMDISYSKDQGQIYPNRIDYTGNSITGAGPTNHVYFTLVSRTDAPVMYTTNFPVTTAMRLKTIDVWGGGYRVRAYSLSYAPYSASTGRSLLPSVQQYDKNATLLNGIVTGGTALPAISLEAFQPSSGFNEAATGAWPSWNEQVYPGDYDGDGKTDLFIIAQSGGWYLYLSTGDGFTQVSNGGWPSTGKKSTRATLTEMEKPIYML